MEVYHNFEIEHGWMYNIYIFNEQVYTCGYDTDLHGNLGNNPYNTFITLPI